MGTTPTYSWPYPEPTDPVANGAQDIEDLALAVESTVSGLTLDGGLTLVTSSIFSGVSTVSIDNVFTSDYQTYKIVFSATHSVGTGNMWLRYRSGGADTTSGYGYGEAIIRHSDGYFSNDGYGTSQQQIALGYVGSRVWHEITVWEPYETQYTGSWYIASHPSYQEWGGGFHNTQTSFDGFKIYPTGGTFTGNVYVYGMALT